MVQLYVINVELLGISYVIIRLTGYKWNVVVRPWACLIMPMILLTTPKTKGGLEISMEEVSLLCLSQCPNIRRCSCKRGKSFPLLPKKRVQRGYTLNCCWQYYCREQVTIHIFVFLCPPFLIFFENRCPLQL